MFLATPRRLPSFDQGKCDPSGVEVPPHPAVSGRSLRSRLVLPLALLLWASVVAAGYQFSFRYETTPTPTGIAHQRWPSGGICSLSEHHPTLVMFVHPRCPCSWSSLQELARLMAGAQRQVDAQVLFFQPETAADDWSHTDLWDKAARIPGVTVERDRGGIEHRRFGARVSGEVFLYWSDGELAFHGGITSRRGHHGENASSAALESLLGTGMRLCDSTPVFGCRLDSRREVASQRDPACASGAGRCPN